ncbi:hypothetical protein FRB90_000255, partial [Tulasnella sp. 427]
MVLDDLVLLVRGQNRGVAIDAYELYATDSTSTYLEARNSTSVSIAQAQLVNISPPRLVRSTAGSDCNESLEFHILAALPYSIDHYALSLQNSSGDVSILLKLELLGDDQISRRPSFGRVFAESDGYDSDSRPSRIAQPAQVLDLQLGLTSRRAVAIQVSAHSNDRTIWAYTIPKKVAIGYWTFAAGATYGTFAYLNQHYNSERRFQRIRNHIRTFANKTIKPKWQSITDVEKSIPEDDGQGYKPPLVRLVEEKRDQSSSTWGFPDGLNFLKSPLSWGLLSDSMTSWEWPSSLANLQVQLSALLLELGRGEGSLWSEIVKEAPNAELHPEVEWDAEVRIGDELCFREKAFLRERKRKMLQAYAKLFNVSPSELDERDLPIVAIAASGGGFRAMANTAGALRQAQTSGILDVTTYISAISGSTWTLGTLYSGVAGSFDPHAAARHIQHRAQIPQLDTKVLDMLITSPTNKYLMAGLIQKAISPKGSLSLVDIYGTLISARLFCPSDISALDPTHLSLSQFRRPVDDGSLPMPIFTAISRHVSPTEQAISSQQDMVVDKARVEMLEKEKVAVARSESRWLWYEFSPYEVGCDEIGAWIPSWAFGREFHKGKSIDRAPEISFSILAGIYASAFCASLQLYYQEVKPTMALLPSAIYHWIDGIMNEREQDLDVVHPVPPDKLPNFVKGLAGRLREGSPPGFEDQEFIPLMARILSFVKGDAGAELNIPYYPLLRRDVDCIIALDASADLQDLWFSRAEKYALMKGLELWPRGVKWPKELLRPDPTEPPAAASPTSTSTSPATETVAVEAEKDVVAQAQKQQDSDSKTVPEDAGEARSTRASTLSETEDSETSDARSTAFVWIGSSKRGDDSTGATPIEKFDEEALAERDGIGIVYMPILANEREVPGIDPYEISTWRTELTMEESEKLMKLAE